MASNPKEIGSLAQSVQPVTVFSPFQLSFNIEPRIIESNAKFWGSVVGRLCPFLVVFMLPISLMKVALQSGYCPFGYLPRMCSLIQTVFVIAPGLYKVSAQSLRPLSCKLLESLDLFNEGPIVWMLIQLRLHVKDYIHISSLLKAHLSCHCRLVILVFCTNLRCQTHSLVPPTYSSQDASFV